METESSDSVFAVHRCNPRHVSLTCGNRKPRSQFGFGVFFGSELASDRLLLACDVRSLRANRAGRCRPQDRPRRSPSSPSFASDSNPRTAMFDTGSVAPRTPCSDGFRDRAECNRRRDTPANCDRSHLANKLVFEDLDLQPHHIGHCIDFRLIHPDVARLTAATGPALGAGESQAIGIPGRIRCDLRLSAFAASSSALDRPAFLRFASWTCRVLDIRHLPQRGCIADTIAARASITASISDSVEVCPALMRSVPSRSVPRYPVDQCRAVHARLGFRSRTPHPESQPHRSAPDHRS